MSAILSRSSVFLFFDPLGLPLLLGGWAGTASGAAVALSESVKKGQKESAEKGQKKSNKKGKHTNHTKVLSLIIIDKDLDLSLQAQNL